MNPLSLLEKYFPTPLARETVIRHSRLVADKALAVAAALHDPALDLAFIEEAALLHDIGTCRTHAPGFGCTGHEPYIRHVIIGKDILDAEGFPRHALVCERHIGVGLTIADIDSQELPLPRREMIPLNREERLICFADLFYSKNPAKLTHEKSEAEVRQGLEKFGQHKTAIFDRWLAEFRVF
ncbi:MAG TPA: HDIG domain-containing metalloprotein [Geobacteraceae bacterium]